jgi:Cys-rich peptide (TIGR04165 family)
LKLFATKINSCSYIVNGIRRYDNMNLGKLNEKCPKCGCKDKTLKRDLDSEFHAHAKTGSLTCSKCGYVFVSKDHEETK